MQAVGEVGTSVHKGHPLSTLVTDWGGNVSKLAAPPRASATAGQPCSNPDGVGDEFDGPSACRPRKRQRKGGAAMGAGAPGLQRACAATPRCAQPASQGQHKRGSHCWGRLRSWQWELAAPFSGCPRHGAGLRRVLVQGRASNCWRQGPGWRPPWPVWGCVFRHRACQVAQLPLLRGAVCSRWLFCCLLLFPAPFCVARPLSRRRPWVNFLPMEPLTASQLFAGAWGTNGLGYKWPVCLRQECGPAGCKNSNLLVLHTSAEFSS